MARGGVGLGRCCWHVCGLWPAGGNSSGPNNGLVSETLFWSLDQPDCCGWVTEPLKHIDEFLSKSDMRCPKLLRLKF